MVRIGGGVKGLVAQAKRAAQRRAQRPSTGHVLLVMVQRHGEAGRVLSSRGVRETDLLSALKVVDEEPSSAVEVALERAQRLAGVLGEPQVREIHLLLAIVRDPRTTGHRCLDRLGSGAGPVVEEVAALLGVPDARASVATPPAEPPPSPMGTLAPPPGGRRGRPPLDPRPNRRRPALPPSKAHAEPPAAEDPARARGAHPEGEAPRSVASPPPRNVRVAQKSATEVGPFDLSPEAFPLLAGMGRNLTAEAARGEIDPVIGREREVEALLDVLARRRANNPVVVGPPGVGKTAVVEALARRLVEGGEGVHGLQGKVLVEVSAGALVSGTGVRGALAERLKQLREEVGRSDGRVVLFIDEIHAIVGGEGPDDLASELKAALARGELPCIGATTEAEYRRHFERDPALARRFSAIHVDEPTPSDATRIVRGIAPRYEVHHAVAYEAEALAAAVELSVRYLPERHLPDKAVSVMDLAAARIRRRGGAVVDVEAVAGVVSEMARVPVDRLLMRDADRLLSLEASLAERVVGHERCIMRIAEALRKGAAGFRGHRPLGTFLLLGPTGVGKTETAKAVSDLLFAGGAMTRLDMSEFSEPHAVARLLGAPPGYVGHEQGGQLTEPIRRRPYQLILLDEIEKAHPEVLLSLLPLLDEGRLTDGRGRTVDFTNTVVFMTSNLGAQGKRVERRVGFGSSTTVGDSAGDDEARALAAARAVLPPELWNRIDEPLWFGFLTRDDVGEIARRMLRGVGNALSQAHGVRLEVEPSAIEALIEAGGYDEALGARPMRRVIGRHVEAPLAARVLEGQLGPVVCLRGGPDGVCIDNVPDADAAE